jgi:hypothetical protein
MDSTIRDRIRALVRARDYLAAMRVATKHLQAQGIDDARQALALVREASR